VMESAVCLFLGLLWAILVSVMDPLQTHLDDYCP
jgi:hypothetical protein